MERRDFIKKAIFAGAAMGLGINESFASIKISSRFDTIIRGGLVYAGDGRSPYKADVGIKDGKISAIGDLGRSADRIINAKGKAVSPGFIDLHTHTDGNLFDAPLGDSKIYQGVTLDIGGNCGDSPFPSAKWESAAAFYSALSAGKIGINYKSFIGQGQLRSFVVGDNNVPATSDNMSKMIGIVSAAMEQGAAGISCGLEYTPGSYAPDEEIVELCKVVARYGGLFAIHMRNEDDRVEESVSEAIKIAQASGVRLQISHLKAQNAANWHKASSLIKLIEDAKKSGLDIAFDRYPYIAFSTGMSSFIPMNDRQGTTDEVVARLKDTEKSKLIGEYADSRIKRLGGSGNVVVTSCTLPENKKYIGKSVKECAQINGVSDWEFIRELLISERVSVSIIGFAMREENVKLFLSHDLGMPASDGSVYSPFGKLGETMPHPRSYGTFPRFIGKYCRDEKLMSLERAIMKCTSLPASRLGLKDRGLLNPGYKADIVVFDPNTIIDNATFALPHQYASGIEHVFVNGAHTIKDGMNTGELFGSVLS